MDPGSQKLPAAPLSRHVRILAASSVSNEALEPAALASIVKERKLLKLMSRQDCLALAAALKAVGAAGLGPAELAWDTGLYLTVGTLPFDENYLGQLADCSSTDGKLDMKRGSTEGYAIMSPMLTFKCLPNMPLYHISSSLGVHGPYYLTYSGPGQVFTALDQAITDLLAGRVRFALWGAVADQSNFLVRHSALRAGRVRAEDLTDAASVWVLTLEEGRPGCVARLTGFAQRYRPVDPYAAGPKREAEPGPDAGPVQPFLELSRAIDARAARELEFESDDGIHAAVRLEVP